jgi:zinc/manganese transport system substrate-binding protein
VLTQRLSQVDAANAATYKTRAASFHDRWTAAIANWEKRAAGLKGVPVVVYHKDQSYLLNWLGLREVASLEPKPGIPPSTGYLVELLGKMQSTPAKVVVYSAYNSPQAAEWLSDHAKIPNTMLPYTVGGSDRAKDLFGLFDDTIDRLTTTIK